MKPISDKLYYELCFAGLTPIENKQTMIQLTEKVFALPIPSMAFGFMVNNYGDESEFMYTLDIEEIDEGNKTDEALITKKLTPPGSWRFLCTSKECSEDEAAGLVDKWVDRDDNGSGNIWYVDYRSVTDEETPYELDSALLSFHSLLRSKSLDPVNNNYAILLKNE